MKQIRYFLWIWIMLVGGILTGCQAEPEEAPVPEPVTGVLYVRPQGALDNEPSSMSAPAGTTKSNGDETLTYTLEAWSRGTDARCMLHTTATGSMTAGVQFAVALIPGVYDLLLWADYGNGRYLTSNLREVTVETEGYAPDARNDAFACALPAVEWNGKANCNAILKRPLACMSLYSSAAFDRANTVSMTYDEIYTVYDVLTGEVSAPQRAISVLFPETVVGSTLVGEDFLFVPTSGAFSFSVSVGDVTQQIDDVPLKPNYSTHITSSF